MDDAEFTKEQEFVPGRVVVVPNMVRINGAEILIPDGSTIRISDISNQDVTTVTVTMFVRSLSIRAE